MKSAKPEHLSEMNKKIILDLLRKEGSKSRADIKRTLGMSFPAVSANVKELLDAKLLLEIGISDNELGRKGTLLEFNAKMGYVLGVDIGRSYIRTMIADIAGNPLVNCKSEIPTAKKGSAILRQTNEEIDKALKMGNIEINNLLCVVIGIPGIFDKTLNKYRLAPFVEGWEDIQIDLYFKEKFNIPVFIENSVKLGVIGEKWRGVGKGYSNIAYINYGMGIGSAFIIQGELYTGSNGAAGEIGYLLPNISKARSMFSEEGALEQEISGVELERKLKNIHGYEEATVYELFSQKIENDSELKKIITEIKELIGIVLVNLTCILNPEIIIISGGIGRQIVEKYTDYLCKFISAHTPFLPKLIPSELGEKANVMGAIGVALRYVHKDYKYLESI